jgi:hypothetical protein
MNTREFDELAGRIDAVARGMLHLTAALEMKGVIDGPRLSDMWRNAARSARQTPALLASQRLLQELAGLLDEARRARQ